MPASSLEPLPSLEGFEGCVQSFLNSKFNIIVNNEIRLTVGESVVFCQEKINLVHHQLLRQQLKLRFDRRIANDIDRKLFNTKLARLKRIKKHLPIKVECSAVDRGEYVSCRILVDFGKDFSEVF